MLNIDATNLLYVAIHFNKEYDDFSRYKLALKSYIDRVIEASETDSYLAFLDEGKSFRHFIYPEYKAKRVSTYLKFKNDLVKYAKDELGFVSYPLLEADDLVCLAKQLYPDSEIAGVDKDLLQIKGTHWRFKNGVYNKEVISEERANFLLMRQLLSGDVSTDNIKGLPGFGEVKAEAYIKENNCKTIYDLVEAFVHTKNRDKSIYNVDDFILNLKLVKLLQLEDLKYLNIEEDSFKEFIDNAIVHL